MDPADLERKITDRSTAVIVVHMAGAPADIQPIVRIAKSRNLKVIEDCAQANGASVGGKRIGTFGDLGIFSFQVNKNITAGEGGMLVTDDVGLYERCNAAHDIGVPWVFGMPQFDNDIMLWGCGSRMGELNAAVIRVQLRKLDQITTAMRTAKRRILDGLRDVGALVPRRVVDPAGDSGAFLIVCLQTRQKAVDFAGALNDGGLIPVRLADYHLHIYYHVRALVERLSNSPDGHPWTHPANVPLIRNYARGACPQSDDLFERAVMISVPSKLSDQNIEDVIGIYRRAAKKIG
jgi:dTDP-4-amino-4,6-dideoxygalactose transaminase